MSGNVTGTLILERLANDRFVMTFVYDNSDEYKNETVRCMGDGTAVLIWYSYSKHDKFLWAPDDI